MVEWTILDVMKAYVILIRGINVGGNNKVPMAELHQHLEDLRYDGVSTYIASGNVLLVSDKRPDVIKQEIENLLSERYAAHSALIKVLVLTKERLRSIVENKPEGFGDQPDTYHSDAIFLIDIDADEAMAVFDPRDGVDAVWPGDGVIYSQRVSALRTKSRLGKLIGTPPYKSMTIRSWNTTVKLLELIENSEKS